jgi:hypothetical protein
MLTRRELIAGGAAVTQLKPEAAAAAQREQDYTDELQRIGDLLLALRSKVTTREVNEIRERERSFLRLNQRFPQCVDVGIRVWERMQDWHIENGRVLTIQRAGDGHWQMDFIMSVLILKLELKDDEIGLAYDR